MCACSSIQQRASKTRCLKDRNHLAYRFLCLSSRVRNQFLEEEKKIMINIVSSIQIRTNNDPF